MAKIIPIKEIHKLLYHIKSLDVKERGAVEEELSKIRADGLSKREFDLMLRNLRAGYKISEIDRASIEQAFAPYFD